MSTSALDPTHERLLGILAAGVPHTAAALAVGVSDSYISQLLATPEFSTALAERRSHRLESSIKYENTVESVRDRALKVLDSKLAFVKGPLEAARIFQILDSARRGTATPPTEATPLGVQQVAVILPQAAKVHISMNSQNQVIEVEGRSMATLPSKALPALAKQVEADKQLSLQRLEAVRQGVPTLDVLDVASVL